MGPLFAKTPHFAKWSMLRLIIFDKPRNNDVTADKISPVDESDTTNDDAMSSNNVYETRYEEVLTMTRNDYAFLCSTFRMKCADRIRIIHTSTQNYA